MGELIDLDAERRKSWIKKIERMQQIGGVAIFGTVGEVDAKILQFKANKNTPSTERN